MNDINLNLPTIWKWGKRVGFSILDQGLFSGSHFVLNIFLARWLSPQDYGAFAVAYAAYLFCSGFHYALILDPLAVFGPLVKASQWSNYVKKSFVLQSGLSIVFGLIISLTGLFIPKPLGEALIGIGLSSPFLLSALFLRNSYYIQSESEKSALVSSVYFVAIIGGIIAFRSQGILNLQSTFWILGGGGLIAVVAGSGFYRVKNERNIEKIDYHGIITSNWGYGKWIALTALANGFTTLSFPILIGLFLGLSEVAAFRGMQNVINPMYQVLAVSGMFLVPILSRKINQNIIPSNIYIYILGTTLSMTFIYIVIINIFSKPIIKFIFNQDFYLQFTWLIAVFSVYLLMLALGAFFSMILRATKRSKFIYTSKIVALVVYTISVPFLWKHPALSLVMGMLILVTAAETIVLFVYYLNTRSKMRIIAERI